MKHIIVNEPISVYRPRNAIRWRIVGAVLIDVAFVVGVAGVCWLVGRYASATLAAALRMGGV